MEHLTSPAALNAIFVLALCGLGVAIIADHLQLLAKYNGALNQRVAHGYNIAMKVMVANRLGAVVYFLLIAFNVDNGLSPDTLAAGYAIAVVSFALPTIALLLLLQRQFARSGSALRVLDTRHWPWAIVIASFVATAFNLLGLTLPWLAGATYPEWRLTLVNSSFLFNTLFTVVNVFYVEHRLAGLIDSGQAEIHGFVAGVTMARLLAFIVVGVGIGILA